ncbi:matrixin family metalloprotease [Pseudomonas sp. NPDC096950]|uniref:matrixin family metalloprotease n=1 Tax=Pseudomonas sp. NPDC096950 TaxID=3364485 RepID=UPI00383ACA25
MPTPTGSTPSSYSSLTGVKAVDSLLSGTYWQGSINGGPTNLTYSFMFASTSYFATNYSADNEYKAMYDLSLDQRGGIIRALASWSSVANINFTQTTDNISNVGDLRFGGYADMGDQAAAWAYTPSSRPNGGDVWIGDPANEFSINGSYDYMTYIHEIGHAIGLKHPFSANSLNTTILDPSLDDVRYTVMSYNNNYSYQPTTPMLLDIVAIQALYGANTQWHAGDNVYSWNYYDKIFETIWDSGGTDTIDASNQLNSVNLDLNEGAFSSIGVYFEQHTGGTVNNFNSGLAIAYGTKIENAIGSTFNDVLKGNALNNVLDGREGVDTMYGGAGNDTYYVDNRDDVVVETGTSATEIDSVFSTVTYNLVSSANVENLTLLTNANINAYGNASNNVITGNAGNNILDGDTGADTLIGGAGNDTYVVDNLGDVISETSTLATEIDTVRASLSWTLGANLENLELTGTGTINATGNSQDNVLTGNNADNILNGMGGLDTLIGGAGDDSYIIDQAGELNLVKEIASQGFDTLILTYDVASNTLIDLTSSALGNFENVTLNGAGAFDVLGNNQDNILVGNAFANNLQGGAGNDVLDGGAGSDTLSGGTGNDIYFVSGLDDTVVELANEGRDEVRTAVSYSLGANIEDGTLLGTAGLNLNGNELNNVLTGNAGNNVLDGGVGADTMIGGAGNDNYYVDNVGDVIIENSASASETDAVATTIDYTLGANLEYLTLLGSANLNGTGNASNNVIIGNAGNNILDGGIGGDYLAGGTGNDTYIIDNAGDVISETSTLASEIDTVRASINYTLGANLENLTLTGTGNLYAIGNTQDNVLTGNSGNNVLDGGAGADTMDGGAGNDNYYVDNVGDVVIENGTSTSEIDAVATTIDYTLGANLEYLTLLGSANLNGTGNASNNVIIGNAGNNILDGGIGGDYLAGGTGNDTYIVDNVGDVISETSTLTSEIDTVRASVNYTLGANLENITLTGTDNIYAIGNAQNNVMIGNDGDNELNGRSGLDTMIGGKGNDIYNIDQAGELTLVQENANEGIDTLNIVYDKYFRVDSIDLRGNLQNVENIRLLGSGSFDLTGNSLNNVLTGNADNNVIDGGVGADTMDGGGGNDTYVVDNVGDVIIERGISASEIDTVNSTVSYTLSANIENLNLGNFGDLNGTGNAQDNRIIGNSFDNILDGGAGADYLEGGWGNDTYVVDNVGDVISETIQGGRDVDSVLASISYALGANLENITLTGNDNLYAIGNTQDNVLTGNDGDNELNGRAGLDTMIGGKGNDIYDVDQKGELALIRENANEGTDTVYVVYDATAQDNAINLGLSNLQNVENVQLLGSGAFTVNGNSLNNTLIGNADSNTLDGGLGADTLDGGAGNDNYYVDNVGDVVIERGTSASEIDAVASTVDFTLGANLEYLTLLGSANLNGTGNASNNVIIGNTGNNILDGGIGGDYLAGGTGNDTYIIDNVGDVISETSTLASEIDTVRSSVNYALGANLENITLTGTDNIYAIGNAQNNVMIGNDGDNELNGRAGLDTMIGGKGNDIYDVDQPGEIALIQENANEGKDTIYVVYYATAQDHAINLGLSNLQNVEDVRLLGTGEFSVTGNSLNNTLIGNADSNTLDGGLGADTMDGGAGNDNYYVDNVGDVIIERGTSASEIDAVSTTVDYTLSANIEYLTLLGSANLNGTGNASNNQIIGNAGNNILDGGLGGDYLAGEAGNDTYIVDNVGDFVNETSTLVNEIDTVRASVSFTLGANLENLTLTGTDNLYATGNALNNVLIGNDGNNILDGFIGADTMDGGAGNDSYYVDNADDVVIENGTSASEIDAVATTVDYTLGANLEYLTLLGSANLNGTGNASNNVIIGNAGNNVLDGGTGGDYLAGGTGNDTYIIDNVGDVISETSTLASEIDTVRASVNYALGANLENITLTGTDNIYAIGNAQNNVMIGNDGDNELNGRAGLDTMIGGKGNDIYDVDQLGEMALIQENANEGKDTVYVVYNATAQDNAINLNLSNLQNVEDVRLLGTGAFSVTGNSLNNTLTGNADSNTLDGGLGADTMDGGAGNDNYYVDNAGDVIIENGTSTSEIDAVASSVDYTLGTNLEYLTLLGSANLNGTGNTSSNIIIGNAGNNILDGGVGGDYMAGGTGNDTYIVDNDGDVVSETSTLASEIDTVRASVSYALGANLENLTLTGNDNLFAYGNDQDNVLIGNDGDNTFIAGWGLDTMIGGKGNDRYNVDQLGEMALIQENANEGKDTVYVTYNATVQDHAIDLNLGNLQNIEDVVVLGYGTFNVTGNSLNNSLTGNTDNNILDGGLGADTLAGGTGNDTYIVDNVGDVISETSTLASEIDTVRASVNYALGANLENITLTGTDNIYAIGNTQDNVLTGNDGDNELNGRAGLDTMIGGKGNDIYDVDQLGEMALIHENANEGKDTVYVVYNATAQDNAINLGLSNLQNVEDVRLLGSGAFTVTGNSLNNTLIGNADSNILDGGMGADTLDGGAGNDSYYVDNLGDVVIERGTSASEIDAVASTVDFTLGANLEYLTLLGSANLNGTGNASNNVIIGNTGNNILDGGIGGDYLAGGTGNDTYIIDNVGDVISETSTLASEIDTVRSSVNYALGANLENITLTGTDNLYAIGNTQNNVMIGNDGDNELNGRAGLDTMIGGKGNDIYDVDQLGEMALIQENANEGKDTVYVVYNATAQDNAINLNLSNLLNVEDVRLLGTGAFSVTGNSLNNTLTGNADSNSLNGGAGADTLTGGAGADKFVFSSVADMGNGTNRDVITDFNTLQGDKIDLTQFDSNLLLNGVNGFTFIGAGDFSGAGQLRFVDHILSGNVSGNAGADFEIQLVGVNTFSASDLVA